MRPFTAMTAAFVAALAIPTAGHASLLVDRATSHESLVVDASGHVKITWYARGATRTAVVIGSRLSYPAKGVGAQAAVKVPATVPFAVVQYRLANGQQFALQKVQRLGQFGKLGPVELHVARWRGELPQLDLGIVGTPSRASKLCGAASYHGTPIHGTGHTASGNPTDALGRNVYLEVGRSGGGWYRMEGVLLRPDGFALYLRMATWQGAQYRALLTGPNVAGDLAPDVIAVARRSEAGPDAPCPSLQG
jgi:hypothetical protein